MIYRTCLTLRWLMVPLAITICCLGNEYPGKGQVLNESYWQQRQIEQLRQEQYRMQREQQYRDATRCTRNYGTAYGC